MSVRSSQIRTVLIDLTVAVAVGLMLALLGPFGSFDLPFPVRLAYWVSLTIGGYVVYRPAMALAEMLAERLDLPRAAMWAAGCLVATVPMTFLVWLASGLSGARDALTLEGAGIYYGNVLVIAAIVSLVFWIFNERAERQAPVPSMGPAIHPPALQASAEVPVKATAASAPFLERMPPHLGRDLLALEMQDHYVTAHTMAGSSLILMRMRDAISELSGIEGTQVHRSWWVARAAVRDVTRDGRNIRLVLARGLVAPVARSRIDALQDAGWLSR